MNDGKYLFPLTAFFLTIAMAGGVQAEKMATQYKANLDQEVCQAMTRAADFLVSVQQHDKDGAPGWSWEVGGGPNAGNISGLAALSLLDAYGVSGKKGYLTAARNYAESLVASKSAWSAEKLPYKPDIEFLARLSTVTGDPRFLDTAREGFSKILARSPRGAAEVKRILTGRRETALTGFDVALGIRAAVALGERGYALEMADEVIRVEDKWYRIEKNPRYSLISGAAMAQALKTLDAGHYRASIDKFQADLVKAQQESGSWMTNETQPSAYAVMALADGNPAEQAAYRRGIEWLKSTMLKKGAYATYNDYMPEPFVGKVISEVHAEALSALSMACRNP